jgi:hypothetical protein
MAWIHVGGATLVGPPVEGGTLVLMGGRRAIVTPAGEVLPERVRCPEALTSVDAMVTRSGRQVVVALGTGTVYRFDDPLGAPVPVVKVETDRRPDPPGARFAGARDGRARFVLFPGPRSACAGGEGCDGLLTVDVETGEHARGPWRGPPYLGDDVPAPSTATDLTLRWIEQTRTDPVLAAITNGTSLGPGEALAVSRRTAARVALATGQVLDLVNLAGALSCNAARAGATSWIVCRLLHPTGETQKALRLTSAIPLGFAPTGEGELIRRVLARRAGSDAPLPDGRVAFLRPGLGADHDVGVRSEDGKEVVLAHLPPAFRPIRLMAQDDPQRVRVLGHRLRGGPEMAIVDPAGQVTLEAVPGVSCAGDACECQIEVGETHGIALCLDWGMGAWAWSHDPPASFEVTVAAAGVTRDGGRSFSPVRVPPAVIEGRELRRAGGVTLHVNEVGMVVDGMARVGWDPADDAASGE